MAASPTADHAAAELIHLVEDGRRAQGLPPRVTDPAALRQIAALTIATRDRNAPAMVVKRAGALEDDDHCPTIATT
jgi:hypothetical protein